MQKQTWRFKFRPLIDYGTHLGILLNDGSIALVDHCDRPKVEGYNWTARPCDNGVYANGWRDGKHISLAAFLLGQMADHRDGNTLDNRRGNLRPATCAQNCRNRRKASNNTSGYKGVCFRKDRGTWLASIRTGGPKLTKLGTFKTAELAARAYDAAAAQHFGEFAVLNFPYDAAKNSAGCYDLAVKTIRDKRA